MIHPTTHTIAEWQRLATEAYRTGHNHCGHRYSVAAAIHPAGEPMPVDKYDWLQSGYRAWLCFNEYPV